MRDFNFSEITVLHSPQCQFRLRVHKHARKSLRKLMISCTPFDTVAESQVVWKRTVRSRTLVRNNRTYVRGTHMVEEYLTVSLLLLLLMKFDSKAAVEKQVAAPLPLRNLLPSCLSDQTAMCGCRLQSGPGTKSRGDKCEKCPATFHSGLGAI